MATVARCDAEVVGVVAAAIEQRFDAEAGIEQGPAEIVEQLAVAEAAAASHLVEAR